MRKTVMGALLAGAMLALGACGPADDGGGGVVGPACRSDADCAANDCCGNGTGAVAFSQRPSCPASCSNGRDPYSPCVDSGSAIVHCDSSLHCGVATGLPGSCTQ
jgi:hypothetical protein